jgi:hypothetical protein
VPPSAQRRDTAASAATPPAPPNSGQISGATRLPRRTRMSEHTSGSTLVRRPASAIKPAGSPAVPLWGLVAQAATRQGPHRLEQMPGLARIRRRTRTHTLLPPLPRLPVSILFSPNLSHCQLEAHHLTTAPSPQISRRRRNSPRPPPPQLRPRRNCSDPPLAAKSILRISAAI